MSQVTEWIPCTTPPVRDGWYEIQQCYHSGRPTGAVFMKRYSDGGWDFGGLVVWVFCDKWRGLSEPA
jgi:hypothetical protein